MHAPQQQQQHAHSPAALHPHSRHSTRYAATVEAAAAASPPPPHAATPATPSRAATAAAGAAAAAAGGLHQGAGAADDVQAPKEFAFVSGVGGGGGGGGGGGAQPEIVGLGFEGNMFGSRSGVITMGSVGLGGKEGTAGGTVAGGAIGGGVGCGGDVFGGTEREEKRLSLQNLVDSGEGLAAGWERESVV